MSDILQKLIAFIMSILALFGIGTAKDDPNVTKVDDTVTYTLNEKEVEFAFDSNPTTGYNWFVDINGDSVFKKSETYKSSAIGNIGGAGGTQYYTFAALKSGKSTITFRYERSWENEPPVYTYVAEITVDENHNIIIDSFTLMQ